MVRKAALLLSGHAASSLLLLVRNLLIARMIPVADYGIAATFAVAMAVVEMASALGLHQQIVQDKRGADPAFQAALQGFQLLRGAASALGLFLIAYPLAAFMGIPEIAPAYQLLALVPLLNGLVHFDIHRMGRDLRFGPGLLAAVLPAGLSVLALWPLAQWFGDWRVMLYALLIQGAVQAAISHLLAETPYRLALRREVMAGALRFGWPIWVNGLLLFAIFNGDRIIVGREMGMAPLALLSMGLTLTLAPALVFERAAQALFLPLLAPAEGARAGALARMTLEAHLAFALMLVVATLWLGPPLLALILGAKYAALAPLLPALAVQQALHVAKHGSSPLAVARARTDVTLITSLPRVLALAPAAWIALEGGGLLAVIATGIAGEALGLALSLWLSRKVFAVALRPLALPFALGGLCLMLALLPGPAALWGASLLGLAGFLACRGLWAGLRKGALG